MGVIFEFGYSSAVFGLILNDGRRVVAKVRPWGMRLQVCWEMQQFMWEHGFPCPEPLGPPGRHSGLAISFEDYLPGGYNLARGTDVALSLGRVLAEFVNGPRFRHGSLGLEPDLGFLRWNEPGRLWRPATDIRGNLNGLKGNRLGLNVSQRWRARKLKGSGLKAVVGHGDWWSDNVRWESGKLFAVDDWDLIVSLPEPAIAGVAGSLFADGQSTIEESAIFLNDNHASGASGDSASTKWLGRRVFGRDDRRPKGEFTRSIRFCGRAGT